MGLTADNSMPVQAQQVQGAPSQLPPRPSADILLRRKKKAKLDNHDTRGKNSVQPGPASADILTRRKK